MIFNDVASVHDDKYNRARVMHFRIIVRLRQKTRFGASYFGMKTIEVNIRRIGQHPRAVLLSGRFSKFNFGSTQKSCPKPKLLRRIGPNCPSTSMSENEDNR